MSSVPAIERFPKFVITGCRYADPSLFTDSWGWRWILYSKNVQIVAQSAPYRSKSSAIKAVKKIKKTMQQANSYKCQGTHHWILD